jgi:hypothetical protein
MHRTQVLLEEHQYRQLKDESARTGRSIGDLVRDAISTKYSTGTSRDLLEAIDGSFAAWSQLHADGQEYVERIREGLGERLRELGWD